MSEEFNRLTLVEIEQAEANLLEDIKNYKDWWTNFLFINKV
jgi:hypothetical protein